MSPDNRSAAEDPFRELDTQLADLRATAKSLREQRPSRADNLFHPGRRARQEADFGASVVAALKEIGTSVRNAFAQQEAKFGELERKLSELERNISDFRGGELAGVRNELKRLREQQEEEERLSRERAEAVANAAHQAAEQAAKRAGEQAAKHASEQAAKQASEQAKDREDATKRAAEFQQQVEQIARDSTAKIEQLAAGQKDLANEFRERIQNLLDEQRVTIRQLALKASEDAVLSDRARRAAELKLEELAKRLPPAPPV